MTINWEQLYRNGQLQPDNADHLPIILRYKRYFENSAESELFPRLYENRVTAFLEAEKKAEVKEETKVSVEPVAPKEEATQRPKKGKRRISS